VEARHELGLVLHALVGAAAMADHDPIRRCAQRAEEALATLSPLPSQGAALRSACRALADEVACLERTLATLQPPRGTVAVQAAAQCSPMSMVAQDKARAGWLFARLARLVVQARRELGVLVDLETKGEAELLGPHWTSDLLSPMGHLVRNALAHGGEPPALRAKRGQGAALQLHLGCWRTKRSWQVVVADDGPGIDLAALEEVAATAPGAWPRQGAAFLPGVSTAARVDDWAGRGMGLPLVARWVTARGGEVELTSPSGGGTAVAMRFPRL
jgi:chemotaxis protein histidine kinase CheA